MFINIIYLLSILLILTIYPSWFVLFVILGKCLESILDLKGFGAMKIPYYARNLCLRLENYGMPTSHTLMLSRSYLLYPFSFLILHTCTVFTISISTCQLQTRIWKAIFITEIILGTTCILQVFDLSEKNSFWFQLKFDFCFPYCIIINEHHFFWKNNSNFLTAS